MDKVADCLDLGSQEFLLFSSRGDEFLLLLLEIGYDISAPWTAQDDSVSSTFLLEKIGNVLLGLYLGSESSRYGSGSRGACLLLGADLLLDCVDSVAVLARIVGSCVPCELGGRLGAVTKDRRRPGCPRTPAVVLEHGDDLVDDFYGGIALALALPDLLRVATTLGDCSRLNISLLRWDIRCAKL